MTGRKKRAYGTGSLFERHDSWYGQWLRDGRLVKRRLGRIRSPEFPDGLTRKQAEKRLRELMQHLKPIDPSRDVNFAEAAERHVSRLEAMGRKPSTIQDYRSYLRIHLLPALGSRSLATITPQDLDRFQQVKLEAGCAPKSVRNWMGLAHGVFTFAQKQGWLDENPARLVDKPVVPHNTDIRFLNLGELDKLLEAVPDGPLGEMERVLYLTAAMTGLRQGEALGLRWRDVDFVSRRLRVRRSLVRGSFETPKSRLGSRSVPLASRVANELRGHFDRSHYRGDDELVFCHPDSGRPFDRSKLLKRLRRVEKRAGVRKVTFHELRHTFGTTCAAAGIPLRTIMEWMGHQDIKTTMIYAHYVPGEHEADWIRKAFSDVRHRAGIDLQPTQDDSAPLKSSPAGSD